MKRLVVYRALVIGGVIALLEVLCLTGVIDKITMQAAASHRARPLSDARLRAA